MADVYLYAAFPFAIFGVTWMMRYTHGPWDAFLRLRELAGIEYLDVYDGHGAKIDVVEEIPDEYLAKLLGCFWCLGSWVAFALAVIFVRLVLKEFVLMEFLLLWLGSIGIAGFLHEAV